VSGVRMKAEGIAHSVMEEWERGRKGGMEGYPKK
jgi:hypothetical protein